jgi:adhesin/invasin
MSRSAPLHYARSLAILGVATLAAALGACGADKLGPSTPASVSSFSGDSQTVLAGNRASAPLVAVVENSDGSLLPNVEVRWSVTSGGGSLAALVDTTDVNGRASNLYLSPAIAGTAKVFAGAGARGKTFTLTIAADTIGQLTALEGNGAAGVVGAPLTLVARAIDRFGNPIRNVGVTWSSSGGSLQNSAGTTDSTGKATNVITVGPDTGTVAVTATSRFNSVTFTVSALK